MTKTNQQAHESFTHVKGGGSFAEAVRADPCVRNFAKHIVRIARTKDPVDALKDINGEVTS